MNVRRLAVASTALVASGALVVPLTMSRGYPVLLNGVRPAAAVVGAVDGLFDFSSADRVGCHFSDGAISSMSVLTPRVKAESKWQSNLKFQYVRLTVDVQAYDGDRWPTIASTKRTAHAVYRGWTGFRSISPFTTSDLGRSSHSAYRVVEKVSWYDPKGRTDAHATQILPSYHYSYDTSRRGDCQNRLPVAHDTSSSTYPGEGNVVTFSGRDPDGDSPLTLNLLGSTDNGTSVPDFAERSGARGMSLSATAAEVGDTIDVKYSLTDPAGATSDLATLAVAVLASPGGAPTSTPTSTPTTTPSTPPVTTPSTPPRNSAPGQMQAPSVSDHTATGAGYNGAIQVTFTDSQPGSGNLSEIEYALNGTTTSGSWTPAGAGQSETKTIAGLTNGASYTVALRACNSNNICGTWSPASSSATPYTVPAAPSVSASDSGLTIEASWSGGGGGGRALSHYSVCFQDFSCTTYAGTGSASQTYPTSSTTYSVTVTAFDAAGQSSPLTSVSAMTAPNLVVNGSFEAGQTSWAAYPGTSTNFVVYANRQVYTLEHARDGTYYGATNTTQTGGGIFQDVTKSISAGNTYCASAYVRTQYPGTPPASGVFSLWMIGGSGNERGSATYSNLGDLNAWTLSQACVTATGAHTSLRIQFYPTPGTGTTEIDSVTAA